MSEEKEQVRKFYDVIWNQHNRNAIPEVLHADVKFRGSLGEEKRGHAGFAEYLDVVHAALGEFRCVIEDLVCEPGKVFAKMTFGGVHRGQVMGYPPTGKRVSWSGAALFTFVDGKVGRSVGAWRPEGTRKPAAEESAMSRPLSGAPRR